MVHSVWSPPETRSVGLPVMAGQVGLGHGAESVNEVAAIVIRHNLRPAYVT